MKTLGERLRRRLEKRGGCLEWMGFRMKSGHGQIGVAANRYKLVHQVAWELANGPIPTGLCVCHHCDNPPCCRLDHLFLDTQRGNIHDAMLKGRMSRNHQTKGEDRTNSKLTVKDVIEIRSSSLPQRALASRLNVDQALIWRVQAGKVWRHVR